ncbi:MAG: DNA topoisomerase I [Thermoplasmata archaeon]|nr:MAG: DNA topoisomerase I [Thermoplasmata archaeon]
MKLVICEKNIAARRIAYILSGRNLRNKKIGSVPVYEFTKDGETWVVIGLKGHIVDVDYPSSYSRWWAITPRKLIEIQPEKKVSEKKIATALKKIVKEYPFLIVATDFDREGELIGVEVVELIRGYNSKLSDVKRARFSAITPNEIKKAFEKLVDIDYNLSQSGEARRIIDLVWGAVLTRFISLTTNKVGKDFLSIGRVQSPTLALLVEREKEIQSFKPTPFWRIIARLKKEAIFEAFHTVDKFWDKEEVTRIYEKIKDSSIAKVKKIEKKTYRETPPAPFNTTTFLQAASSIGVSAQQAMNIAEELYMNGLISYPRTDNTVYPSSLNLHSIVKKLKSSPFSKEAEFTLTNMRKTPTRGKKYATDHPPIHPVDAPSIELTGNKKKIYELIVRRFLATLTKDATSEHTKVLLDISGEEFQTKGYRIIEPQWRSIYFYGKPKEIIIPDLSEGEDIKVTSIKLHEDQTKPPHRYTQGSLIAKMEELSLGTKSTRHEIIHKLYQRRYITLSPLAPTPIGIAVIEAMGDCDCIKPKMTAELEKDMNLIAEGKKTLDETVRESREMLIKVMETLEKNKADIRKNIREADRKQNIIGKCPNCSGDLIIRRSKNGKRFIGCTEYPKCTTTYPLPQKGTIIKTDKTCSYSKTPIIKIRMKGRKIWETCLDPNCEIHRINNNKKDK